MVNQERAKVSQLKQLPWLLGKCTTNSSNSNAANEIKSHLLTLVDRSNVTIIYATNLFKNFDKAFLGEYYTTLNILYQPIKN